MGTLQLGVLIIVGVALSGGLLGARLFQKLHIPQVIGYITIGLILGESCLGLITPEHVASLSSANLFALGIIGFLVGGELRLETFRKYARQFTAILLGEGVAAFVLVGVAVTLMLYWVTGAWVPAVAGGVVFGAIASATDPASTLDVLWESRARGVLTTSLIAIVALDDALAMTLYGLGTGAAQVLSSGGGALGHEMLKTAGELGGAIAAGGIFGYLLSLLLWRVREPEKCQAVAVGVVLLDIGVSRALGLDVILSAMTVGFTLVNLTPRRSMDLFGLVRSFSLPIYVFFFVLVGARISLTQMPLWLWGIVGVYVVGRSLGKMGGAYFGARLTKSPPEVRRYLGMGLFAQGGVAIGLSVMASEHLTFIQVTDDMTLSQVVVSGVTATTLIVQLAGPPMVKLAAVLSREAGRNVTRDDVVASWRVADVMDGKPVSMPRSASLTQAMATIATHDYVAYPVVDQENRVVGALSLEDMKEILADQSTWDWVLVADVMASAQDCVAPDMPLADALSLMRKLKLRAVPVVDGESEVTLTGMLGLDHVEARIGHELLLRQGATLDHAA